MDRYEVEIGQNVMIPMRDGVRLAADVYRPRNPGRFPALVERTPYDKSRSSEIRVGSPQFYAPRGYAVVIEDVRGRGQSEGIWYPFRDDAEDGYETIEWVARQPWCDGRVGTLGGSYCGFNQYLLAARRPPHLVAMVVRETASDLTEEWVWRGGAFEYGWNFLWAAIEGAERILPQRAAMLKQLVEDPHQLFERFPPGGNPFFGNPFGWLEDWLAHPDDGSFWSANNLERQHTEIDVPIYHVAGWYDIFLRGTLAAYTGLRQRARSEKARRAQRLIIGPWVHGSTNVDVSQVGEVDFGPEAALGVNAFRLQWYDQWLRGRDTGILDDPPVRIFVMGDNIWRREEEWPPSRAKQSEYFLRCGRSQSARSLNDGCLSTRLPGRDESPDSYEYDPAKPTATIGGATLYLPGGPMDQRRAELQSLTYTTEPLAADMEVTGRITAELFVASSAVDTDLVVKLTDVYSDGRSMLIADGIRRARYRMGKERPVLMDPGTVYPLAVDLWSTSNVFKRGHRIRVSVASSNFPRFDRNMNTGGPIGREDRGVVATNTVYHDAARPSRIILPVIPG